MAEPFNQQLHLANLVSLLFYKRHCRKVKHYDVYM